MHSIKSDKILAIVILVMAAMWTACGSSRTAQSGSSSTPGSPSVRERPSVTAPLPQKATPSMEALLREANSWIGTPYKYGGNTREGVDCSGFVLQVYLKALNISLPRTSAQQSEYCRKIRKEDMQPGDLLFFSVRRGGTVGHVGIYVGDGKMIHASSRLGVVIVPINSDYFATNYLGSGRVEAYGKLISAEVSSASAPPAPKAPQAQTPQSAPSPSQPSVPQQPAKSPTPIRTVRISQPQSTPTPEIDNDFFD